MRNVYIAFDFDDHDVVGSLRAEMKRPDCPWKFIDKSIKTPIDQRWVEEARRLISESECVLVLCGPLTHDASGVAIEVQIAQSLNKRYFLISGTRVGTPTRPQHARQSDRIWTYRWPTLKTLLEGGTPPPNAAVS